MQVCVVVVFSNDAAAGHRKLIIEPSTLTLPYLIARIKMLKLKLTLLLLSNFGKIDGLQKAQLFLINVVVFVVVVFYLPCLFVFSLEEGGVW